MDTKKSNKRKHDTPQIDIKKSKLESYFPTREQFLESCMPQEFSLQIPIMKYIWENPSSPKVYEKLIECCKIFFIKNPILVLNNSDYHYSTEWKYCVGNKCRDTTCKYDHKVFKMEKLKDKKIWLAQKFSVHSKHAVNVYSNCVSHLIPKIFQYDVKILTLLHQHLSYNELKYLTAGVKQFFLTCNKFTYDNSEEMPLENVIELFAGSEWLFMNFFFEFTNATCKDYGAFIKACNTVKKLTFHLIPDVFNVPIFYHHLKRSKNRTLIDIFSLFNAQRLDGIIDKILETQTFEFVPAVIDYFQQDKTKREKIKEIQKTEAAKYR